MNIIKNSIAAVAATAALGLVAACGDVEPPANDIGQVGDEKSKAPALKGPVKTNPNRMDFGDGEARVPARPNAPKDDNRARLDFGETWRG